MDFVMDFVIWGLMAAGGFFVLVGGIGLLRFPDLFSRLHAASVTETLGAGLLLSGMLLQSPHWLVGVKIVLLGAFLIVTSPTAAHATAKAALQGGAKPIGRRLATPELEEDASSNN
ncbi:MAG: hypothetical protein GKR94_12295 [Gammaproteobacteria bacterium]|nr:hypothetical protein [Gammaproteobacteria bacterium]